MSTPVHPIFLVQETADPSEVRAVDAGLDAYNSAQPRLRDVRSVHVIAKLTSDRVIGGAIGRTWGSCCELLQLWVHEAHRGQGFGTELMHRLETEAEVRGCSLVYLTTYSFQAPTFYDQLGYTVALETTGYTGGITMFCMQKRLRQQ